MDVITHECGHAFQGYLTADDPILEHADITMETAETHSMSMEFFTNPWMDLFFGDRADDFKRSQVEDAVAFIPYGCMVDEFQHIVYDHPEMTPQERKAAWKELEKVYKPHLDFGEEYPFFGSGSYWQRQNHIYAGPFYYIELGMGKNFKWLAKIFAFFGVCVGLFGIGTFSQVNGISSAVHGFFDPNDAFTVKILPFLGEYSWSVVIASLILSFCVAAVLIGGVKRIASVSQIIVPFMAIIYFVFAVILICCNITKVPAAFATIVTAAFSPKAITGGAVGSMLIAMQKGVARGIFSNEAGLGSAPIAAAAAQTNSPVRQGLVSMTGTFIDTIIICTLTGLSIVLTGAWQVEGLEGVQVTTYAFQQGLPFPAQFSSFILMLCLVFFAFTTILGWDYYSERCLEYLSGGNMKHVKIYRWIYILAVFIGPYMTVSAVWTIADIFNGLMAIPNMIALFALSGVVVKETRAFFQHAKEEALAEHRSFEKVCEENLNEEEAPAN